MRVAPVGLLFRDDRKRLFEQARISALPTHVHPLGIEGAQLLALAVALASATDHFNREEFFAALLALSESDDYRTKFEQASRVRNIADLAMLGNGIEALQSVPTAVASFALAAESFEETIGNAILLGGDTDTIAAMAGAVSGAYLGVARLPVHLVALLESSPKGRDYIRKLAGQLFDRYCRLSNRG